MQGVANKIQIQLMSQTHFLNKADYLSHNQTSKQKSLLRAVLGIDQNEMARFKRNSPCWNCGGSNGNLLYILYLCPWVNLFWEKINRFNSVFVMTFLMTQHF